MSSKVSILQVEKSDFVPWFRMPSYWFHAYLFLKVQDRSYSYYAQQQNPPFSPPIKALYG